MTDGSISSAFFPDADPAVRVDPSFGTVSFFSGKPNFAARFARTSSLTPVLGVLGVGVAFVGVEAVRFDVELGSKGKPNLSARALRACCSGVSGEEFTPEALGMATG